MKVEPNLQAVEFAQKDVVSKHRRLSQTVAEVDAAGITSLTTDNARLQTLKTEVHRTPEVRSEKVAGLTAALRSGTYQIDPNQVASAMAADQLLSQDGER